jgi:hypothetical protein
MTVVFVGAFLIAAPLFIIAFCGAIRDLLVNCANLYTKWRYHRYLRHDAPPAPREITDDAWSVLRQVRD